MLKETILDFVRFERKLAEDAEYAKAHALPEKCFFRDDGTVLCYPRAIGASRYPYAHDGFTLWAYSSGYISLNESTYYFILPAEEGKQPYAAFFGGIKDGRGDGFFPISITGVARQATEKVKRFTVYTPAAAYYITQADGIIFYVRAFVSTDKKAIFTVGAINAEKTRRQCYLSTYINALCMHAAAENFETKWFKQCNLTDDGFVFESVENIDRTHKIKNYGGISRTVSADVDYAEHTCSRADYAGGSSQSVTCATPLFTGHFEKQPTVCRFGDTAAAGDIYAITLGAEADARIDYVLTAGFDKSEVSAPMPRDYAEKCFENAIAAQKARALSPTAMTVKFGDVKNVKGEALTQFFSHVVRQVEFAALAKNSGVSLLGVRDVVQQLEAALIWTPKKCRAKFLELLGFIDPSGRPPRQYSLPAPGALPETDTRAFIDQGVWIISAMHTYLAYTDDRSILDEECGYYKIVGKNRVKATPERDTVYDHLCRIADYLVSNIDTETGCLRALYGDWNDALDGLGVSLDKDKEFGSGVSVMASLQLYENLGEMLDIFSKYGDRHDKTRAYESAKKTLETGLKRHAIVQNDGVRKILHGWGDKKSYTVGGFCDVDGKSRDTLTASAFFVISGAYLWDKSIKRDILSGFSRLDGKYGLKTFEPYFAEDAKGVGRIVDLPKGTAENAAVYVHAAMFGIWALFLTGESEEAWRQLLKILPLTHDRITTTPFVMSNSYCHNEELGIDGESMSDWFTGSANALVKAIVRYVFGIVPALDGLYVSPTVYMPTESSEISLSVKGKRITLEYDKRGRGARTISVNGIAAETFPHPSSDAPTVFIPAAELKDGTVILVTD